MQCKEKNASERRGNTGRGENNIEFKASGPGVCTFHGDYDDVSERQP